MPYNGQTITAMGILTYDRDIDFLVNGILGSSSFTSVYENQSGNLTDTAIELAASNLSGMFEFLLTFVFFNFNMRVNTFQ